MVDDVGHAVWAERIIERNGHKAVALDGQVDDLPFCVVQISESRAEMVAGKQWTVESTGDLQEGIH